MASLGMGNSHPLTVEKIDEVVLPERIGNYAYGYLNNQGRFVVRYIGRSDSDLRERIKHGVDDMRIDSSLRYECFKFSYAESVKEAYEKECHNYHDFGGDRGFLCNEIHPAKPEEYDGFCPICGQ